MEILAGPKAEQLVHDVLAGCTKEFLVARSAPEPMEGAAHRVTDLLQRGIDVRALFHHTARTPPAVRDYARTVTERGARLRTVQCVPGEFAVVDRRLVLLGHMSGSTCLISEQSIVDHFTRVFEHLWEGDGRYPPSSRATRTPRDRRRRIPSPPYSVCSAKARRMNRWRALSACPCAPAAATSLM